MNPRKGYKTELDPNNKQTTLLKMNCGTARFVYNWGLSMKKKSYEETKTSSESSQLYTQFIQLRETEFPWIKDMISYVVQGSLRNLDTAFQNFFRRNK